MQTGLSSPSPLNSSKFTVGWSWGIPSCFPAPGPLCHLLLPRLQGQHHPLPIYQQVWEQGFASSLFPNLNSPGSFCRGIKDQERMDGCVPQKPSLNPWGSEQNPRAQTRSASIQHKERGLFLKDTKLKNKRGQSPLLLFLSFSGQKLSWVEQNISFSGCFLFDFYRDWGWEGSISLKENCSDFLLLTNWFQPCQLSRFAAPEWSSYSLQGVWSPFQESYSKICWEKCRICRSR